MNLLSSAAEPAGPGPAAIEEFHAWIGGNHFTCLAGRAAVRRRELVTATYPMLPGTAETTAQLHSDLAHFVHSRLAARRGFVSFAAVFLGPTDLTEVGFERALWDQLARLHEFDAARYGWVEGYSIDPESSDFAFCVAGHPFFVAGLNPAASRISRRAAHPVLVFNSHVQFARLKAEGTYYALQRAIRERELRLQGTINPMLSEHGDGGEASQYSGREVGDDWHCPFPHRP